VDCPSKRVLHHLGAIPLDEFHQEGMPASAKVFKLSLGDRVVSQGEIQELRYRVAGLVDPIAICCKSPAQPA
jgi:hypothetical protein